MGWSRQRTLLVPITTTLVGTLAADPGPAEAPLPPPLQHCVAFEAMALPFRVCVGASALGGGFSLHGPGQPGGVGGLLFDNEGEPPFFLLSTDYEAGVPVGGHPPPPHYFRLTLRWESAGPWRGILAAEFCGPEPVPVRLGAAAPELRFCGQWATLVDGLAFPSDAARRRGF